MGLITTDVSFNVTVMLVYAPASNAEEAEFERFYEELQDLLELRPKMQYLDAVSKMTESSVCFQDKPFNITVIQVYAPTRNVEEAEVEWFCEDLQDLLELTPKKHMLFIILECKSRKSRNTWSNRQIWPWSTE